MKLNEFTIINDYILNEANIINANKEEISIKDSNGTEVEHINTLDKIITNYLKREIFNNRTTETVKKWFSTNFYNWLKKGAVDPANDMMDEKKFQEIFYVPLDTYIDGVLAYEKSSVKKGVLTKDIIMKSFPDYVQDNPADAVVFSGGRLFRLKKLTSEIEKVHEYLIAGEQTGTEEDVICPIALRTKDISRLTFPEAHNKTAAWHQYTENMAEKVSAAQAMKLAKSLKKGKDYKIIDDTFDDILIVQLKSQESANVEGIILKHCVGSYGRDVELGKTIIYSVRNREMLPVATLEVQGKKITQLKGPKNSTVKPIYHKEIKQYLKKNKFTVGGDIRNVGGWKK